METSISELEQLLVELSCKVMPENYSRSLMNNLKIDVKKIETYRGKNISLILSSIKRAASPENVDAVNIGMADVYSIFNVLVYDLEAHGLSSSNLNNIKNAFLPFQRKILHERVSDKEKEENLYNFVNLVEKIYVKAIKKTMDYGKNIERRLDESNNLVKSVDKSVKSASKENKRSMKVITEEQQEIRKIYEQVLNK